MKGYGLSMEVSGHSCLGLRSSLQQTVLVHPLPPVRDTPKSDLGLKELRVNSAHRAFWLRL